MKTKKNTGTGGRPKTNTAMFLIACMFFLGTIIACVCGIPVKHVMQVYSYDVLVILLVMELFTNLIVETGIMQMLAIRIADLSQGRKRLCLVMFGLMMFLISSLLNNITAVMMVLPIVFVLLKSLDVDKRYVCIFFCTILALSNTGGAASPIGDFPAIVIMTSGITTFLGYLTHAFPLFALTSAALVLVWGFRVRAEQNSDAVRKLAVSNLKSQYKHARVRYDVLVLLMAVFACMFVAWSLVPQEMIPPEIIAILGYAAAITICSIKGLKISMHIELQSPLTIASFLYFAAVIRQTGILVDLANYLQSSISNPKLLMMVIMIVVSVAAGVFSAGPAAAAMMPIIVNICSGPQGAQSDWIAVAYAASICAGSSLFMWSATAGFILSERVNRAGIRDEEEQQISWGVLQYLPYGIVNYLIQISIALIVIAIVL